MSLVKKLAAFALSAAAAVTVLSFAQASEGNGTYSSAVMTCSAADYAPAKVTVKPITHVRQTLYVLTGIR